MASRNKIAFHVLALVLGLFAFAIGMIAYALVTGEIRGKLDWILFADDPRRFRDYLFTYVFIAASMILWLWLMHNHPRR
jgi:hypothetical protein